MLRVGPVSAHSLSVRVKREWGKGNGLCPIHALPAARAEAGARQGVSDGRLQPDRRAEINDLGGQVRKGEKATPVVFWRDLH